MRKRNEDGAIDLASIMTGLIVLGLIGGVIAATIFLVIPWAQDEMAKKQVSEIKVAETTYAAGNADPSNKAYGALSQASEQNPVKYATLGELVDKGLMSVELDDAVNGAVTTARKGFVCANTTNPGGYEIAVRSATGNVFYTTDEEKKIQKAAPGVNYCLRDAVSEEEDQLPTMVFTIDANECSNAGMYFSGVASGGKITHESGASQTLANGWNDVHRSGEWTVQGNFSGLTNLMGEDSSERLDCLTEISQWDAPAQQSAAGQAYQEAFTQYKKDFAEWEAKYMTEEEAYEKVMQDMPNNQEAFAVFEQMQRGEITQTEAEAQINAIMTRLVQELVYTADAPVAPKAPAGYQAEVNMEGAFYGAKNLQSVVAPPVPMTSTKDMFGNATKLTELKGDWDMSQVTTTKRMFSGATAFNQDISGWDMSNVTDMSQMFQGATSFNQNINSWDISKVITTTQMFSGAISFNQPLNSWNTQSVIWMDYMFQGAMMFNQDLNNWNTSNVKWMGGMFSGAYPNNVTYFNGNISNWDVSGVGDMERMFYQAQHFNQDISGWNVSSVQTMDLMFNSATAFNQDISGWNVDRVGSSQNFSYNSGLSSHQIPAKLR